MPGRQVEAERMNLSPWDALSYLLYFSIAGSVQELGQAKHTEVGPRPKTTSYEQIQGFCGPVSPPNLGPEKL